MLLADRYLRCSGCWIDLATARAVLVAVRDAGAKRSQVEWAERCAMLSLLRHPLLNPLIDFGVAGPASLFEVYAPRGRLVASPAAARTVMTHAMRFLAAHGIQVPPPMAPYLLRQVERSRTAGGVRERPIGVVLQPRRAMAALGEVLVAPGPPGTTTVRVAAGGGMGLRTLWTELARRARVEGFVPVCPEALERWPMVVEDLREPPPVPVHSARNGVGTTRRRGRPAGTRGTPRCTAAPVPRGGAKHGARRRRDSNRGDGEN